jgi:hypothetical protein
MLKSLGFENLPIRFFKWDEQEGENSGDFLECTEADFLEAPGDIEYMRHTVFDNGVKQICLTKNPLGKG